MYTFATTCGPPQWSSDAAEPARVRRGPGGADDVVSAPDRLRACVGRGGPAAHVVEVDSSLQLRLLHAPQGVRILIEVALHGRAFAVPRGLVLAELSFERMHLSRPGSHVIVTHAITAAKGVAQGCLLLLVRRLHPCFHLSQQRARHSPRVTCRVLVVTCTCTCAYAYANVCTTCHDICICIYPYMCICM